MLDKAASFLAFLLGLIAPRRPDPIAIPIRRNDWRDLRRSGR